MAKVPAFVLPAAGGLTSSMSLRKPTFLSVAVQTERSPSAPSMAISMSRMAPAKARSPRSGFEKLRHYQRAKQLVCGREKKSSSHDLGDHLYFRSRCSRQALPHPITLHNGSAACLHGQELGLLPPPLRAEMRFSPFPIRKSTAPPAGGLHDRAAAVRPQAP
jgi:hypothetical protein